MEASNTLQIGPYLEAPSPGSKVDVQWLGQWYGGTVITLGPQNKLRKLKVGLEQLTVLMDPSLLKPIDRSLPTHQQLSSGAQVAYYDHDMQKWVDGTIVDDNAHGMVLVRWQRSPQGNLNTSWFEPQDVAVTIDNEAFGITVTNSVDDKEALNKVPSLEDILEERHRHTSNERYQELPMSPMDARLPPAAAPATPVHRPLRTSSSMKHMYASSRHSADSTPDKRSSSLQRAHSSMSHQYALLRGKLDHTNRPAVQSYRSRATGIPHHPTSKFFRNVSQKIYLPPPSSIPPTTYVNHSPTNTGHTARYSRQSTAISRTHSAAMLSVPMHHSPTMLSIRSESAAFRHIAGQPLTHSSSGPVIYHDRMLPHQFSNRPLPELPSSHYEVPVPVKQSLLQLPEERAAAVYAEVDSADKMMSDAQVPHIESASPPKVEVELGGSALLSCQVRSPSPLTYEWRKNGQKLSQNDEHIAIPSMGMLQLYSVTVAQAGFYECIATNDVGSVTYTCQLTVNEAKSCIELFGENETVSTLDLSENDDQAEVTEVDNTTTSTTGAQQIPEIRIEDLSMDTEDVIDSEKTTKLPARKKKDRENQLQQPLSDMDNYLDGYGEDYGALATQSDVMLPQDDKEDLNTTVLRQLRFNSYGRRVSREEQPLKSKSDSSIDDSMSIERIKLDGLTKLKKLTRPKKSDKASAGKTAAAAVVNGDRDGAEDEGTTAEEQPKIKQSHSEDSMDAHMSYESSTTADHDEEREGGAGVKLPLAEQHYTEGIQRLQLSHTAYEEEHFGKKKTPKKRGLRGIFSSKNKKDKKVTFA